MRKFVLTVMLLMSSAIIAYAQQFPVGYALIDTQTNKVVQAYGSLVIGQETSTPPAITLPNGDVVYAPAAGPIGSRWRLVPRILDTQGSDPSLPMLDATSAFDGTSVIVKPSYGPPAVPQTVSGLQAKVALSRAGLLTSVQNWINTQSAEVQLEWNTASTFERDSALITRGAAALNLTQQQVDDLFRTAITIKP